MCAVQTKIPIPQDYAKLMIGATCHLGGQSLTHKMSEYAFGRRQDKIWVLNLEKTWSKLVLAAQIIVSYENKADIVVVSSRKFGQKPATMFARAIGATPMIGNFIPGTFTNKCTKAVREPRLIITTDPFTDKQTISEASYINVPCISLANTDNDIQLIDCVIPCNNRSPASIGAIFFILGQLVKYMQSETELTEEIRLKADAYFYRDPAEIEKAMAEGEIAKEDEDSAFEEESWDEKEKQRREAEAEAEQDSN